MAKTLRSELLIDAPIERVWALTVDVEAWPALTPTMTAVERLEDGPLGVGSTARVTQPGQRPAVWTVTSFDAPTSFVWQAKVGPVTMVGGHRLVAEGAGCRNTLTLELSGFGSGLLGALVGRRIAQAIQTENEGFKAAAEAEA